MEPTSRTGGDTVESYLAVLDSEIAGPRRRRGEMLAEARAHLEDSRAELLAQGHDHEQAEREAIERFGPPRAVAARMRSTATLVYAEAVRAGTVGLLVFCATWVFAAVPLAAWLPLLSAAAVFPAGLAVRVWERRRRSAGDPVPGFVAIANSSAAGYVGCVLAASAMLATFAVPTVGRLVPLGWVLLAALAAGAGWLLYTAVRRPRGISLGALRLVAGTTLGIAMVPTLLLTTAMAAYQWTTYDASRDAEVTSCVVEDGTITATVRITNHDDEPHGYLYSPEVVHRDRTIGWLTNEAGFVSVRPGETVTQEYSGVPRRPATGEAQEPTGEPRPVPDHFTCRAGPAEMERDLHHNLP